MPVIHPGEGVTYEVHGSRFSSCVAPSRGSRQLCAWRLTVPAGLAGAAHRPTREEVLLVQEGDLAVSIDGQIAHLAPGDVVLVPAGSMLRVDCGTAAASLWVTTTSGIEAVLADGSRLSPPWAA